jgi:hypothetical protein
LEEEHKKHKLRGGETPDDEANYRKGKRGK